jgi:hypothetical protein
MVSTTTIPLISFGVLIAAMLVFIWWWFPRTYRKGMSHDMKDIAMARQRGEGPEIYDLPPYSAEEEGGVPYVARPPTFEERVAFFRRQYDVRRERAGLGPVSVEGTGTGTGTGTGVGVTRPEGAVVRS